MMRIYSVWLKTDVIVIPICVYSSVQQTNVYQYIANQSDSDNYTAIVLNSFGKPYDEQQQAIYNALLPQSTNATKKKSQAKVDNVSESAILDEQAVKTENIDK